MALTKTAQVWGGVVAIMVMIITFSFIGWVGTVFVYPYCTSQVAAVINKVQNETVASQEEQSSRPEQTKEKESLIVEKQGPVQKEGSKFQDARLSNAEEDGTNEQALSRTNGIKKSVIKTIDLDMLTQTSVEDGRRCFETLSTENIDSQNVKYLFQVLSKGAWQSYDIYNQRDCTPIPLNELSSKERNLSKIWFRSGIYKIQPSQDTVDFYSEIIYPKLKNIFEKISKDSVEFVIPGKVVYEKDKSLMQLRIAINPIPNKIPGLVYLFKTPEYEVLKGLRKDDRVTIIVTAYNIQDKYKRYIPVGKYMDSHVSCNLYFVTDVENIHVPNIPLTLVWPGLCIAYEDACFIGMDWRSFAIMESNVCIPEKNAESVRKVFVAWDSIGETDYMKSKQCQSKK